MFAAEGNSSFKVRTRGAVGEVAPTRSPVTSGTLPRRASGALSVESTRHGWLCNTIPVNGFGMLSRVSQLTTLKCRRSHEQSWKIFSARLVDGWIGSSAGVDAITTFCRLAAAPGRVAARLLRVLRQRFVLASCRRCTDPNRSLRAQPMPEHVSR